MPSRLAELATLVGGRLRGDGQTMVHGAAPLYEAASGDITFIDQEHKSKLLADCSAAAVVVASGVTSGDLPAIEVDDVHAAFTALVLHFRPRRIRPNRGISPAAIISPQATIGDEASIYPMAVIEEDVSIGNRVTIYSGVHIMPGCTIGDDVTLYPGVVIYEDTQIGARSTIHAGAVLGANGFGYDLQDGKHVPTQQLGYVRIEDDVEIGANTTIDRGTYGATVIGAGTKLDNQVQIGHNCRIGRHNLLCSQVGIAGSTTTGDYVVMGGQAGVRDHIHIGAQSIIAAMSGLTNHVPEKSVMMGIPATPDREQKLKQVALSKLPEMRRQFKKLSKQVEQLVQNAEQASLAPEWLDESPQAPAKKSTDKGKDRGAAA